MKSVVTFIIRTKETKLITIFETIARQVGLPYNHDKFYNQTIAYNFLSTITTPLTNYTNVVLFNGPPLLSLEPLTYNIF